MKDEKNKKNGVKIYCIYFENGDPDYKRVSTDDPKNILYTICKLGGTETYRYADSLRSLISAFSDISKAIEINFKLEHYKK